MFSLCSPLARATLVVLRTEEFRYEDFTRARISFTLMERAERWHRRAAGRPMNRTDSMVTEPKSDKDSPKKPKLPPETRERYEAAGRYLQQLRQSEELTQLDISKLVGLEQPSIVSHVETGRARVPEEKIPQWVSVFKSQDPREVAKRLLYWYHPPMWQAIYGGEAQSSSSRRKSAATGS